MTKKKTAAEGVDNHPDQFPLPYETRCSGRVLDEVQRQVTAALRYLDHRGRERPDPTPVAPPVGYRKGKTLQQQIRDMVRNEQLQRELDRAGFDTFEEADDFDVDDDFDPKSPYEMDFDMIDLNEHGSTAPTSPPVNESGQASVPVPEESEEAPEAP